MPLPVMELVLWATPRLLNSCQANGMVMFFIFGVSNRLLSHLWVLHLLTLLWFLELHLWDVVLKYSMAINHFISMCVSIPV